MTPLDRRQWLKTAGLASTFSLFGGLQGWAAPAPTASRAEMGAPIRLSSNENPYGPSPKVRQAMTEAFDTACRYPYAYANALRERLAELHGLTPEHILITGGSTEGLKIAGLLYGMNGGEVIAAEPTFKALLTYTEEVGGYVNWVPCQEDLQHDLEGMARRVTNNTSLVFVCNPNNPTGTLLPAEAMRNFCETVSRRVPVFADEAYFEFIQDPRYPSMTSLVKEGYNVIVSRTFSKVYGLAGLRIGYLIARPDLINRLRDKRVAFTNGLAIAAAKAALEDEAFYRLSLQKNEESRALICSTLDELGLRYLPSQANFVFFQSGMDISLLGGAMYERGLIIGRPFPPLLDWCRISTGTMEDTAVFCNALKEVLG